ncbi:hypothetical protein METUNv1_00291 [Methyloversatilis universalis FAM5]|uniref:Uncharacterized protein n=1 Tax=Methyloversatilis universalis (strain ATCC BAA-1314 / DSM 25237 / JCM 13912 / CCUG 52030 / FAM5) TaxID=1000565 RepID=F5R7T3_METUF|nr:hypothetical protein METUNv1_00291 [Methyloversatilis universalis FAM5]
MFTTSSTRPENSHSDLGLPSSRPGMLRSSSAGQLPAAWAERVVIRVTTAVSRYRSARNTAHLAAARRLFHRGRRRRRTAPGGGAVQTDQYFVAAGTAVALAHFAARRTGTLALERFEIRRHHRMNKRCNGAQHQSGDRACKTLLHIYLLFLSWTKRHLRRNLEPMHRRVNGLSRTK